MDEKELIYPSSRALSRCGWFLFIFSVLITVSATLLSFVFYALFPQLRHIGFLPYLLQYISIYGIALPISYVIIRKLPKRTMTQQPLSIRTFGFFLLLAIGCTLIGQYLGMAVTFLPERLFQIENPVNSFFETRTLLFSLFLTTFVAPIGEEVIFRKLLIDRLGQYGTFVSVGVSALFFAIFHQNFYQFFYAFLGGLVLGYLYVRYGGRLLPCILLHASMNFICGVLPACFQFLPEIWNPVLVFSQNFQIYIGTTITNLFLYFLGLFKLLCAAIVVYTCIRIYKREVQLVIEPTPLPKEQRFLIFLTPGFLVALGSGIMVLFLSLFSL